MTLKLQMKTSDKGIAMLVGHEGIVPGPYKDIVGVWTYGIGHTIGAGLPDPASMPRGMPSNLDAELRKVFDLFRKDLAKYEARVNKAFTRPLKQHEFDAAVHFDFNTGAIHRATWVKTFNAGDRAKAVRQIMNWKKPPGIIKRRKEEQTLFDKGIYGNHRASVWQVDTNGKAIFRAVKTVNPFDYMGTVAKVSPPTVRRQFNLLQFIINLFRRK